MSDAANTSSRPAGNRAARRTSGMGFWTIFWSFFLATFLLLAGVYGFLRFTTGPDVYLAEDGQVYASKSFIDALEKELPVVVSLMDAEFDVAAMDTDARIDAEVDALFKRVYAAVPAYLDQHYTVRGEYTQLFTATIASQFQDETESLFERILFSETDFVDAKAGAVARIQSFSDGEVDTVLTKVSDKLTEDLALDPEEMTVLNQVATLTLDDTKSRISDTAIYRGAAATAGAVMVIRLLSKRVAAKAIAKGTTKTVVKTGMGAAGGAGAGAAGGLICGPGAPVCAAVGGVIGGVAGWLVTDKVIVEVDEAINRDAFEAEIIAILDTEKEALKAGMKSFYRARYEAIEAYNTQTLENIRLRDQIGPLSPIMETIETFPDRVREAISE
ncbi:MAG: hypothetical protein AAFR41_08175 [Pseudomonadota bacterium]